MTEEENYQFAIVLAAAGYIFTSTVVINPKKKEEVYAAFIRLRPEASFLETVKIIKEELKEILK